MRVGGRLSSYAHKWARDSWPFRTVRDGLVWSWATPPPPFKSFHQDSTPELESYVKDLLEAGAIEKTSSLLFQGPLFSVPKKNSDKRRVILDLSTLNHYIECPTFRMTTAQDVRKVLPPGALTTSIDLKDACWHFPMHPAFFGNIWISVQANKGIAFGPYLLG